MENHLGVYDNVHKCVRNMPYLYTALEALYPIWKKDPTCLYRNDIIEIDAALEAMLTAFDKAELSYDQSYLTLERWLQKYPTYSKLDYENKDLYDNERSLRLSLYAMYDMARHDMMAKPDEE